MFLRSSSPAFVRQHLASVSVSHFVFLFSVAEGARAAFCQRKNHANCFWISSRYSQKLQVFLQAFLYCRLLIFGFGTDTIFVRLSGSQILAEISFI